METTPDNTNNNNPTLITPARNNQCGALQINSDSDSDNSADEFDEYEDAQEVPEDIVNNRVAQRMIRSSPLVNRATLNTGVEDHPSDNNDDACSADEEINNDEDSVSGSINSDDNEDDYSFGSSTAMSSKKDTSVFGDASLTDRMERLCPGITSTVKGRDSFVNVLKFRKIMGDALRGIPCLKHSLGYSGSIDSEAMHQHRIGNNTATPPEMPERPEHKADDPDKNVRRAHGLKLKCCLACEQVRDAGIRAIEAKWPNSLEPLKDDLDVLDEETALKDCIEHVLKAADSEHGKRETPLALRKEVQKESDACQHETGSNSCIPFFKRMGTLKRDIDALELGPDKMPADELIPHCQQGLRGGVGTRKEPISDMDKEWKKELDALPSNTQPSEVWKQFKIFHTDEIRKKEEDGELVLETRRTGRAKSATSAEDLQVLQDQVDEQAAEQHACSVRMEERLEALSVASEASRCQAPAPAPIPALVQTSSSGVSPSVLSDAQTQHHQAKIDQQAEEIRRLRAAARVPSTTPPASGVGGHAKSTPVTCIDANGDNWKQIIGCCWSHGGSHSHCSGNCEKKKQGHQVTATFNNQLGGSTKLNNKKGWWLRMKDHHVQQNKPECRPPRMMVLERCGEKWHE